MIGEDSVSTLTDLAKCNELFTEIASKGGKPDSTIMKDLWRADGSAGDDISLSTFLVSIVTTHR